MSSYDRAWGHLLLTEEVLKSAYDRISADLPVNRCPSHTQRAFNIETLPEVAEWAAKIVKERDVDAIVACGHSGLVIAGAVSYITRVPVLAVRKDGERPVAGGSGEVSGITRHGKAKRWIWLD